MSIKQYEEINVFGMKLRLVPIEEVKIAKTNVRSMRDEKVIERLKKNLDALEEEGLTLPLLNPPLATPNNEVFAGGYRMEAMKRRGKVYIPLRIIDVPEDVQIILSLSEGMYTPLDSEDVYKAIKRLKEIDPKKWTYKRIAQMLGRTERDLHHHMSVAKIEPTFQDKLEKLAPKELSVHSRKTLSKIRSKLQLPTEEEVQRILAKEGTPPKKPVMTEEKLIKLAAEMTVDRQDEIAKRVNIGIPVDWEKEEKLIREKGKFAHYEGKIPRVIYGKVRERCTEYNIDLDIFVWMALQLLIQHLDTHKEVPWYLVKNII